MRLEGPVDLPGTLQGGQAFRWRRMDAGFVGAVGARLVELRAVRDGAVDARAWPRASAAWHARHLGLGPEVDAARERLAHDPVLAPALAAHPGLRILRQDPWETTVAFITSANNNVPRIEGILDTLARLHGAPLAGGSHDAHAFPEADALARMSETRLRAAGLGYRAPFVREAARMVARGDVDLHALVGAPLVDQREALLRLPGVGPKVADCIALFSLDGRGAFPLDRWVLRAVSDAYFDGRDIKPREAEVFAHARWGDDAGLAQQLLFHAVRMRSGAPGTSRLVT